LKSQGPYDNLEIQGIDHLECHQYWYVLWTCTHIRSDTKTIECMKKKNGYSNKDICSFFFFFSDGLPHPGTVGAGNISLPSFCLLLFCCVCPFLFNPNPARLLHCVSNHTIYSVLELAELPNGKFRKNGTILSFVIDELMRLLWCTQCFLHFI